MSTASAQRTGIHRAAMVLALVMAVAVPWVLHALQADYYLSLASRIVVYAIAATSLNLVLGYGGMVSLGHAAFFGLGAYATGILLSEGTTSAPVHLLVTVAVTAAAAAAIGAISLRTRGVYFIMITLAFAQMFYYIFISLKAYGGDDGMTLPQRSALGIDLASDTVFYYVVLSIFTVTIFLVHRLVNSRFGRVVQAVRENETRMEAIGYPVFRYKLVCFVIAGALASLAGALLANLTLMVSPNLVHWTLVKEFT